MFLLKKFAFGIYNSRYQDKNVSDNESIRFTFGLDLLQVFKFDIYFKSLDYLDGPKSKYQIDRKRNNCTYRELFKYLFHSQEIHI